MIIVRFITIICLLFSSVSIAQPTLKQVLEESIIVDQEISKKLPVSIADSRKFVGARIIQAENCTPVPEIPSVTISEIWSIYVGTSVWYCRVFQKKTKELLYGSKKICTQRATHPSAHVYWEKMVDQRWFTFFKPEGVDMYYFAHISEEMCQLNLRHFRFSFELLDFMR